MVFSDLVVVLDGWSGDWADSLDVVEFSTVERALSPAVCAVRVCGHTLLRLPTCT